MRKAEVSLADKAAFSKLHISLDNVRWHIGGRLYKAPTAELLASMKEGDYALLRPPPSKADQFSLEWGVSTIYLPFHADAALYPINAARELAREEIRRGVPADKRRSTPLFEGANGAWRHSLHSALAYIFRAFMVVVAGADAAANDSVHSFRVYLACRPRTCGSRSRGSQP